MFIRRLSQCDQFVAADKTLLREIMHPDKHPVAVRYSLAHARLQPGCSSLPHRLSACEVYYILEGRGTMHIDGDCSELGPGDTVCIPPGAVQHIDNIGQGDLVFLCFVDPAWQPEDEEIL